MKEDEIIPTYEKSLKDLRTLVGALEKQFRALENRTIMVKNGKLFGGGPDCLKNMKTAAENLIELINYVTRNFYA